LTLNLAQVKQGEHITKLGRIDMSPLMCFGTFLQIFELDLLEWFQWLGIVPKLVRIILESRKIKSKRRENK
jgi:hypothetical protein